VVARGWIVDGSEAGISPGSVVVKRRVTGELFIDSSPARHVGSGLPEH
jgi:hypothetical protein